MLSKKILPLFNFALGSKLLMFEPIELQFAAGETEKVIGNIQLLNYTKTSAIKFFTPNDVSKTFNNNTPATFADYQDSELTIIDKNNQIICRSFPISQITFDTNPVKYMVLDLPFVEIDWTRTKIRRFNAVAAANFYFGVFYIKNSDFNELIK